MVVPWLWRLSRGLIISISVCYCGQFIDKRSLHVIWYDWSMVLKRVLVILAELVMQRYRDSRDSLWKLAGVKFS